MDAKISGRHKRDETKKRIRQHRIQKKYGRESLLSMSRSERKRTITKKKFDYVLYDVISIPFFYGYETVKRRSEELYRG